MNRLRNSTRYNYLRVFRPKYLCNNVTLNIPILLHELVDKLTTSIKLNWAMYAQCMHDVKLTIFSSSLVTNTLKCCNTQYFTLNCWVGWRIYIQIESIFDTGWFFNTVPAASAITLKTIYRSTDAKNEKLAYPCGIVKCYNTFVS